MTESNRPRSNLLHLPERVSSEYAEASSVPGYVPTHQTLLDERQPVSIERRMPEHPEPADTASDRGSPKSEFSGAQQMDSRDEKYLEARLASIEKTFEQGLNHQTEVMDIKVQYLTQAVETAMSELRSSTRHW